MSLYSPALLHDTRLVFTFQKGALLSWQIWWGGWKKKKTTTGWGYFRLHTCSSLVAQQRLWASVLAHLSAGDKHSDECRKAPRFFRAVTKLLLSQFGSRHCKMWHGAARSISRGSGCMALEGAPRAALHASWLQIWMGMEKKKGRIGRKVWQAFRFSQSFTDIN